MDYLSLLVIALAVSLDGFGVGLSYGLRKIKIPFLSILIITLCSGLVVLLSMLFGEVITSFLPINIEKEFGAWIIIGIGVWAIINYFRNGEKNKATDTPKNTKTISSKKVVRINLEFIGFVIEILRVPSSADIDQSGTIKGWEAIFLGLALSLDAIGAGLGASFMGYSPILTASSVSILSCVMIFLGLRIGLTFSNVKWLNYISFLPGIILIIIGICKLSF